MSNHNSNKITKRILRKIASAYVAGATKQEACKYARITELAYDRYRENENDVLGEIMTFPYEKAFSLAKEHHGINERNVTYAKKYLKKLRRGK